MTDRERIYSDIRRALEGLEHKTPYPDWDDAITVTRNQPTLPTLWEIFSVKLEQVNGRPMKGLRAVADFLRESDQLTGYCDPEIAEELSRDHDFDGITLHTEYDRARFEEYSFGISKAAGAIAESGTIVLNDRETASRLGALTPWTHVALLRPEFLWADIPTALRAVMDDDPSIVFVTGPSKTADVEGILIEGVHGPGVQICCLYDR